MSPSCEQVPQSDTAMHVAGSGLHQPTAQSRIFERLFDVHSQAEDLSALSFFWSAFTFGLALETCFGMSTDSTMQSTIARTCFNNYVSPSRLIIMITRTSSVDASWRVGVRPLFGKSSRSQMSGMRMSPPVSPTRSPRLEFEMHLS